MPIQATPVRETGLKTWYIYDADNSEAMWLASQAFKAREAEPYWASMGLSCGAAWGGCRGAREYGDKHVSGSESRCYATEPLPSRPPGP